MENVGDPKDAWDVKTQPQGHDATDARDLSYDDVSVGSGQSFSTRGSRVGRGYATVDGDSYRSQIRDKFSETSSIHSSSRYERNFDRRASNCQYRPRSQSMDRPRSQSRDRSEGRKRFDRSSSDPYRDHSRRSAERDFHDHSRRSAERDFHDHSRRSAERDFHRKRARSSGRDIRRFHSMSKSPPGKTVDERVEQEWPPCFETDGSAFVFDTRSAMFYESKSNFFYDPKSKLYYGNEKAAYFRYDEKQDPPFVHVQDVSSAAGGEAQVEAIDVIPQPKTDLPSKPTIAIKLKSKKLKQKKTSSSVQTKSGATSVSKVEKERIANIEKWNEKQAESKAVTAEIRAKMQPKSLPPAAANNAADHKIKRTAKGEPICTICRRKFDNIEKFRLHERASELHKKNLAKLAIVNGSAEGGELGKRKEAPQVAYTDRAQKRRDMHGAEATINKPSLDSEIRSQGPLLTSDSLGSSNIGNQMLKKMGWNESSTGDQQDNIRKDWERIESLASRSLPPPR